jgi:hypothetical protein
MKRRKDMVRIGAGAAWMGDRIDPARLNAEKGGLDYLSFETMAELTVSLAQQQKRRNPDFPGYDPYLDDRMQAVLPGCLKNKTKIVSNQGWVNPHGAAERTVHWLRQHGAKGIRVAAVTGSEITDKVLGITDKIMENGQPTSTLKDSMIFAEAYLGAEPIVEALSEGADIVLTTRVADPSLFLAPLMYEFGWDALDHEHLGPGQGVGHILECSAQASGGCFMDPGFKEFPDPWNLGFPIAEVTPDGNAIITKVKEAGGGVTTQTVKEQLLYEVHDPANYLTPDVVVDFTGTKLEDVGTDRVKVTGIRGKPRTPTLKVSISCMAGFVAEEMVFTAGPGAMDRALLMKRILEERMKIVKADFDELRFDFPGLNSLHADASAPPPYEPYEVMLRCVVRAKSRAEAMKLCREVDAMAVCGPGMIGKRPPYGERVREIIAVWSALAPREKFKTEIKYFES